MRLRVDLYGLVARDDVYPTSWLRLWSTTPAGRGHQRAYTSRRATVRKPALPIEESGVFCERAELR